MFTGIADGQWRQKPKVKGHVTRFTGSNNGVRESGKAVIITIYEGLGGSVVSSVPCVRRVAGSNPTLVAT